MIAVHAKVVQVAVMYGVAVAVVFGSWSACVCVEAVRACVAAVAVAQVIVVTVAVGFAKYMVA